MDPPENSVNRFGRTIWTVWGYLSGAVARYLRPEVTAEGNQNVGARTEEIDLKSAVNKIDREVKTNNSDSENDRAEVKCSPSKVRAAASVQWENTGVVNNDNNDKLHLHTTEKQTYHPAAWSTGTEAHREGQRDSSDDVQTEEEHANHERKERETTQELEITGKTEQKDGDSKECEENHEKCAEKREETDVMIQSEQDEEQDKKTIMMDHRETEDTGGLKPADEHPTETETEDTVQKNQEKTESDEDQEPESQMQGLLEDLTDELNSISKPERLKAMDKYSDEIDEFFKNQIEEMMLETEKNEERETTQELGEIRRFEQKGCDSDQDCEVNKCDMMREDQGNTDVMIQSDQDEEQDKQIIMMDHRETEDTGGLKPADEHPTETETEDTVQKNQEKTESDEDQEPESQVQKDLTNEVNNINEFSKSGVEEMMLGSEQDKENTEREQDMTKYELMESAETLQSEKHAPTDETELRMTTVVVETIEALEDTLRMDSEQDTSENTPESGTGSSVLATKTEAMFSDLTVCEFPGEPRTGLETDWGCFEEIQTKLHDPQTPEEERSQKDSDETQHDTETVIQTDRTQLLLREHDEFRTELIVETIETKISLEDEEAEALETESQTPVISNVTSQPHQPLEFTERLYKSSPETMDTFSETQGNASASETAETEDRAEPVSTELLEEPRDVEKTALQFVEELTNQVLSEMIDTETGLLAEDPAPAVCVSADASVLEEEQKILTMDSSEEHIRSGPEADGRHEQTQKSIAGETVSRSQEDLMEVSRSGMKRAFDQVSTGLPEMKTDGRFDLILQAFEDSSLDFSVQKCRIAVKNPLVRPPKDPRKLLFRTSVEPQTLRGSAPNKPMIGFKLPGLGAGLRKTEFGQKTEAERTLQQKSVTEDSVKQEQVPAKPKWTPPRHPGMGSPFMMAELKSKLKKPVQE